MRVVWLLLGLLFSVPAAAQDFVVVAPSGISPLAQASLQSPSATEYPFLNLFKATTKWWAAADGSANVANPAQVDTNGFPLYNSGSAFGGWQTTSPVPQQYARPGYYVLTFTGAGSWQGIKEFPSEGGGSVSAVSCVGTCSSSGGAAFYDSTACVPVTGSISGTTLTITANTNSSACAFVAGQPISGAGITVSKFGTPTIITSLNGNSGLCTGCTYTVNYSQTVGSETIFPGGRLVMSISGEVPGQPDSTVQSLLSLPLSATGTATNPTDTVQNVAIVYSCLNLPSYPSSCQPNGTSAFDDEEVYWSGQIVSTVFKSRMAHTMGVIRDLGFDLNIDNNKTTWASRKPSAYYSWASVEMRDSIYAGDHGGNPTQTANSTASFTAQIGATFTGNSSGSQTLTVTAVTGCIFAGDTITSGATTTVIVSGGPGGACPGAGTYTTKGNTTFTNASVTDTSSVLDVTASSSGSLRVGDYLDAAHIEGYQNDGGAEGDGIAGQVLTVTNVLDGTLKVGQIIYQIGAGGQFNIIYNNNNGDNVYSTITGSALNSATCNGTPCTGTGGTGTYLIAKSQYFTRAQLANNKTGNDYINVTNIAVLPLTIIQASAANSTPNTFFCGSTACTGTGGTGTYWLASPEYVPSTTMNTVEYNFKVAMDAAPPQDKETLIALYPSAIPNPSAFNFSADNGTTYKPVFNNAGQPFIQSNVPIGNFFFTHVYDAGLGVWMSWGGALTNCCGSGQENQAIGLTGNCPPEVFVELASEISANPWLVTLYMTSDPATDWVTQYALYIKTNYPSMRPEFEVAPNENWNGSQPPYLYGRAKTAVYASLDQSNSGTTGSWTNVGLDPNHNWSGKVSSVICQAIAKVYNNDTSRYTCIEGVQTNVDWNFLTPGTDRRLTSAAYTIQSPSNIPIQSGCAGPSSGPLAVSQTDCPAPFQQSAAYNFIQYVAPTTYWALGENSGTGNQASNGNPLPGTQNEVQEAYNFFYGNSATQTSIMTAYLATSQNPYPTDTFANLMQFVFPAFYGWAKTCGTVPVVGCQMKGVAPYEGGYNVPFIRGDVTLDVTSATNTSPCFLNTVKTHVGYINDNGAAGDGIPGNFFSNTDNLPIGGTLTNITGTPTILGDWVPNQGGTGYALLFSGHTYASPGSTYFASGNVTVAANAAVAGMLVNLTNSSSSGGGGTDWSTLNNSGAGTNFLVASSPAPTISGFALNNLDGSPFDCSGFKTLSETTLTYVGSANWVDFLRYQSYVAPGMRAYQKQIYDDCFSFGGAGCSQLNVASSNTINTGWLAMGDDINGILSMAFSTKSSLNGATQTLTLGGSTANTSTASTISGDVLTLGGTVSGQFPIGSTLVGAGLPTGDSALTVVAFISGVGNLPGNTLLLSGNATISVAQEIDSAFSITGRFMVGQTLYGGTTLDQPIVITGAGMGNGTGFGDTFTVTCAGGSTCPTYTNVPVNGGYTTFPLMQGMQDYEAEHGG